MYDPVRIPARLTRRRVLVTLGFIVVALIGIVVTVIRTMPHPEPVDRLTLDELVLFVPDAADTELLAQFVRNRLANPETTPEAPAAAPAPACAVANTPHGWDGTQRENATTIVRVGVVLGVSEYGTVVALAT